MISAWAVLSIGSWSARRTHVSAPIYCYFRQCFSCSRALSLITHRRFQPCSRGELAHTPVGSRRAAARAARGGGAAAGRGAARARARRGPLARRGSRPPPPRRDRRGEGAPLLRLCDMAILFYKAYTQFMNSHHPKCTLSLTLYCADREIRREIRQGTIQQPCPFAVGDGVAPRGPARARPAPHHVPQTARTPRRARRTSHWFPPRPGVPRMAPHAGTSCSAETTAAEIAGLASSATACAHTRACAFVCRMQYPSTGAMPKLCKIAAWHYPCAS